MLRTHAPNFGNGPDLNTRYNLTDDNTTWVSFYESAYAECSHTADAVVADFLAAPD